MVTRRKQSILRRKTLRRKKLRTYGGNSEITGDQFIQFVMDGNIQQCKQYIETRQDVNYIDSYGNTGLFWAVTLGHSKIIQMLVASPTIDINIRASTGDTAIHVACSVGNISILKKLVTLRGANINVQNNNGETPLFISCVNSDVRIVAFLVHLPTIDVNVQTVKGVTALSLACYEKDTDIAQLLLSVPSINVNMKDNDGKTALMYASFHGNNTIIQQLCKIPNIDVNIADKNSWTALRISAYHGNIDTCKLLIDNGADITVLQVYEYPEKLQSAIEELITYATNMEHILIAPSIVHTNIIIKTTDTVYDSITMDNVRIADWIQEDPRDHIAIIFNTMSYITSRHTIRMVRSSATLYECIRPNSMSPENINKSDPLYNINKLGILVGYVHMKSIVNHILGTTHSYFAIIPTGKTVTSVVSRQVLDGTTDLVSAAHCQDGQGGVIYDIVPCGHV